jgi:hypothetical protein
VVRYAVVVGILFVECDGERSRWSSAAQGGPRVRRAPKLTGVGVTGSGKRTALHFKLNQNATVTV